jgi:hypothetical protein
MKINCKYSDSSNTFSNALKQKDLTPQILDEQHTSKPPANNSAFQKLNLSLTLLLLILFSIIFQ